MRKEDVKQKFVDLKWSAQAKVCSLREDAKENIKKRQNLLSKTRK